MLTNIKNFFEKNFMPESSKLADDSTANNPQLALAALMIEVAEADYKDVPEEQESILNIVKSSLNLKDDDAKQLIELAKVKQSGSTDYFQFTRLINENYSAQQRIDLIENLWRIAFSDHKLDKYEEHIIRRISDLLYVSHSDFIATKLRVQSN